MKFTSEISEKSFSGLVSFLTDPKAYQQYTFDLPEGFNSVPVMDQVRFHSDLLSADDKMGIGEKISRVMLSGRPVEVFLEGESLGKFIMNNNAEWDTIALLRENPFILHTLIEICMGDLMGKYLPPLKNTPTLPEGAEEQKA